MASLVAAVSTTAGCAGGSTASQASGRPTKAAKPVALVTEGPQTGDLFVHGTVHRGADPVRGAEVVVELMAESDDLKIGDTVPTWDAPHVTSDKDGQWAIRVDPDTIPSKFFPASDDFLNFDLMFARKDFFATWSNTLTLLEDPKVWRTDESRPGDAVMNIDLDLASKKIALTDSQGEVERSTIYID